MITVMINKIQNSLSRRPQSNFTMPTLGGGTRKKNVTEATEVTEVTEVTEATLLIDDVTKAPPPKHSAKDAGNFITINDQCLIKLNESIIIFNNNNDITN